MQNSMAAEEKKGKEDLGKITYIDKNASFYVINFASPPVANLPI